MCMLLLGYAVKGQESYQATEAVTPTWQWRCADGDALLNFNPSRIIDSSRTLVFDNVPYAREYTLMVVYKPVASGEASVWRLGYDTSSVRGLTTEHIVSDNVTIRYTDTTTGIPVVSTLQQTAPDSTAPYVRLTLGGDTMAGSVKVAEVLYFDQRLGNAMLRRVQSAMAVRYGITLGPVDYLASDGTRFWLHGVDSARYHHRVTGVGRDSTYRVHQLQSRSEMEDPILTIGTDSLAEGCFLVCGDDDAPLTFESDGDIEVLGRRWRVQSTGAPQGLYSLVFDTRNLPLPTDSLVLVVDLDIHYPHSVTAESVSFEAVSFPSDSSVFTLARGSRLWSPDLAHGTKNRRNRASSAVGGDTPQTSSDLAAHLSLYPNPTAGRYTLEVSGTSQVQVTVYSLQGKTEATFSDSGRDSYRFEGTLPSGNVYYATVVTDSGSQTLKLIVK